MIPKLANALTSRITATKRRFIAGGVLQEVEWGVPTGERDERGRQTYTLIRSSGLQSDTASFHS